MAEEAVSKNFIEQEIEKDLAEGATAEKLYVHINTIRKRIDKVNELLQIDWSDNIARMNAELLLRFLNLEEKI